MRITHVMFGFTTGGAELMVSDIISEQAKAGHTLTLLVINNHYEQQLIDCIPDTVRVVKVNRPESSHNPLWLLKYNIELRKTCPEIVHFHQAKGAYITMRPKGTKLVHTVHDTGIRLKPSKKLDCIFSISEAVQKDLRKLWGMESIVITNGISTGNIECRQYDAETSLPQPIRMVIVGRLMHTKKGQDIAIEATGILKTRGIDCRLDIIGDGDSGAFLQELACRNGIDDRVRFLGNRSRRSIYSSLKDYDIFLLPSRNEGFGLTVAEAMSAKVPVITCDREGPMEIIADGKFGTPFVSGNARSLADAIEKVTRNYPYYASLASQEAYAHAVENFSVSRTSIQYLEQYKLLRNGK